MILCDEFRKIASRKEKEQENFDVHTYGDDTYVDRVRGQGGQCSKKLIFIFVVNVDNANTN